MRLFRAWPVVLVATLVPATAAPQRLPVGDMFEDYARLLQLTGAASATAFAIRPLTGRWMVADSAAVPAWADGVRPWAGERRIGPLRVTPHDVTLSLTSNAAYPWGQNDGALWRGRGLTAALEGGLQVDWRGVRLVLRPLAAWQQNRAFALPGPPDTVPSGFSPYASPWQRSNNLLLIDMPQRFGDAAFWTVDPGQSSLSVSGGGVAVGVGTENLWWGPGRHTAIIMTNNAGGVPHAFVRTARPVSIGIGTVEAAWIWGRLTESRYYDSVESNDHRYLTGAVATFQPRPLPGFFAGATRVFYEYYPAGGLGLRDYLLVFNGITKKSVSTPTNTLGNDVRDQMLSVFARWLMPASGFEAYAEWARTDHNWDMRDLVVEPEHSQAYLLGFQQAVALAGGRLLAVGGELTHLERPNSRTVRETGAYYVHTPVRQGYTQRGQVIGSGLGPGGNAQTVSATLLASWGRAGLRLLRQVRDNDAFYNLKSVPRIDSVTGVPAFSRHDVTVGAAVSGLVWRGRWVVAGELTLLHNYNRYYVYRNDIGSLSANLTVRRRF
jgi:hypothetical protein